MHDLFYYNTEKCVFLKKSFYSMRYKKKRDDFSGESLKGRVEFGIGGIL